MRLVGSSGGFDRQGDSPAGVLLVRVVTGAHTLVGIDESAELDVAHDADHGDKLRFLGDRHEVLGAGRKVQSFSQGARIRPELLGQPLVDDDGLQGIFGVALVEEATFDESNPHRFEVARCHDVPAGRDQ